MISIFGILLFQKGTWQLWSMNFATVVFPLLAGLTLALLLLTLGPLTLPIIFSLVFILPWFMHDAFRFIPWLIVTWPIFDLYLRIPLPAGVPDLTYSRALILLFLCIIIIEFLLQKRQLINITPLDILVIVYVIAQIIPRLHVLWFEGVGNLDPNGLLDITLMPVMLYWSAKNVLVSRSHLKWLLYALVIASFLICLSGLYEQAIGMKVFSVLGSSEVYEWKGDVVGMRATGVLGNPAIYGATLGMGILAGMCCLSHIKQKFVQIVLVATMGVLLYGVFASYTRSAWLSVLSVLFVAQFSVSGLWKRTLPILIFGLLLLTFLWNELPAHAAIMQRASNTGNVILRLSLINLSWEKFLERPLLGWGSGALNTFGLSLLGDASHNIYVTFLVDGGLALFLSFLAVVGYLLNRAICIYRIAPKNSLERNVLVAMTGSLLIYLLSGFALELRYSAYFNFMFWICVSVIDYLGTMSSIVGKSSS